MVLRRRVVASVFYAASLALVALPLAHGHALGLESGVGAWMAFLCGYAAARG